MTRRFKTTGVLVGIVAAAALSFGAVGVQAHRATGDTDDHYNPAGKQVTGTSHSTIFTVGGITVTCTNSVAGGKTPAKGLGSFNINPLPTFNDGAGNPCTDNVGGTDTTNTNNNNGHWKIAFKDKSGDETGTEPNTGDKLTVTVPKAGAIVTNSFGCTITVAPNAAFKVTGTYDDVNKFTVNITNLPIKVTGNGAVCPLSATTSSFKAVYTFTPGVSDAS